MQKSNTRKTYPSSLDNIKASITAMHRIDEALQSAQLELQRMEDEGGSSLNDQQIAVVEQYLTASQRIKKAVLLQEIYYLKESQD